MWFARGSKIQLSLVRRLSRDFSSIKPLDHQSLINIYGLTNFSSEDITQSYNRLKDPSLEYITEESIKKYLLNKSSLNSEKSIGVEEIDIQAKRLVLALNQIPPSTNEENDQFSHSKYVSAVKRIGEKIDSRAWPVALSSALVGISIGVLVPCMPLMIKELNIAASEFGTVVSAFGLARLVSNIPSGYLVDRLGRKNIIICGMGACGLSISAAGLTLLPGFGIPWLVACRSFTGAGVSGLIAGSQMYITDISNVLNRVRMFVPLQTSFHFGMIFGPVIGGMLVENIGISGTFYTVGAMCLAIAGLNSFTLSETRSAQLISINNSGQQLPFFGKLKKIFHDWKLLWNIPEMKRLVVLNGVYFLLVSGTQLTILPLLLVQPPFSLSAVEIGSVFAYMSILSVASSHYVATVADKFDKVKLMLFGGGILGLGSALIPFADSFPLLLLSLSPLAFGITILGNVPIAYSSDFVSVSERSQAQSMIRTFGDVGFVSGAIVSGLMTDYIGMPEAVLLNSGLLLSYCAAWGLLWRKQGVKK